MIFEKQGPLGLTFGSDNPSGWAQPVAWLFWLGCVSLRRRRCVCRAPPVYISRVGKTGLAAQQPLEALGRLDLRGLCGRFAHAPTADTRET